MKFKIDGRELEAVEDMTVGESCAAEQALGLDMSKGASAAIAVALFVAIRRAEPDKHVVQIADEVMNAHFSSFEVDDAVPPSLAPEGASVAVQNGQQITGPPPSVPSA